MPNSLSVRDQNSFISAYKNLLNDSDKRIHKSDINTLQKILNKCDKVEVSHLLMNKMESCPKDPTALENTFSKLFDKLEAQNSGMHAKKEDKLKDIQQKLTPVVQDIHKEKINSEIKNNADLLRHLSINVSEGNRKLTNLQETIAKSDVQIKKLQSEITHLTDALKNTSPEAFAAKDAQRLKETETKISKLEARQNSEIKTLENKISAHKDSERILLKFAKDHGVSSAEQDLKKAKSKMNYDSQDTGFGPTTWREHLGSDKYAIKHFGFDIKEGRRQYAQVKEPKYEGKQWQKLVQNFNDAPKKIDALKKEISQLKNEYKSGIAQVKFENRLSAEQEIEQRINDKQEAIHDLEKGKKYALGKVQSYHEYISSQEAKKTPIMAKMEELKSQIQ